MKRKSNDIYWSMVNAPVGSARGNNPISAANPKAMFDMWTNGASTAIKNSSWWQGLEIAPTGLGNRAARMVSIFKQQLTPSSEPPEEVGADLTIKACPPVKEILSRSLVISAPCDIHFAATTSHDVPQLVNQQGSRYYDPVPLWEISYADPRMHNTYGGSHPPMQYESKGSSAFKNMSNIKVETGIVLSLPDGWHSMFMSPFFDYPDSPWRHIPGIHSDGLAKSINVIWNVMVPNTVKSFEINAGDPMMYVVFSDRPGRFLPHPEPWKSLTYKRKMFSASTSMDSITEVIKRKNNK